MTTLDKPELRADSVRLVAGRATFADDVALPGLLHARVLRSPHPHARIVRIDASRARALPGVAAILTHEDVSPPPDPGSSYSTPEAPRSALLGDTVRFVGDRVAVVAADDPGQALRACEAISVEYELLPAVLDVAAALAPDERPVAPAPGGTEAAPGGCLKAALVTEIGDVDRALAEAERVFEATYRVGDFQPASIVPRVALTWLDEDDRLMVRTSARSPLDLRSAIAPLVGIPVRRIRLVRPRVGGGISAHQEVLIEDLCAALTLRTSRPVRLEFSREEELRAARPRHAHLIAIRSGVRDGRFVALEMRTVVNAGAHGSRVLAVARAGGERALSLYRCPNRRHHAQAVFTNLAPTSALGSGDWPHGVFALESHVDEVAFALGADPLELRRENHVREGDAPEALSSIGTPRGRAPTRLRSCGLAQAIQQGARAIGWNRKRRRSHATGPLRRGTGMAIVRPTSGVEGIDVAAATVRMNEDGSFHLMVSATDLGNGAESLLCQIAAETLSVGVDRIVLGVADTDLRPFDGGALATSTFHATGRAVEKAARDLRIRILKAAGRALGGEPTELDVRDGVVAAPDGRTVSYSDIRIGAMGRSDQPDLAATSCHTAWDVPSCFAAVFAEVDVDVETGLVHVLRLIQAVDGGAIINPLMAENRIEGAVVQGLCGALADRAGGDTSQLPHRWGDMALARALDAPQIETILVPTFEPTGPLGAKALLDVPANGLAPAIANAAAHATGARFRELPLTPDRVFLALERLNRAEPTSDPD